MVVQILFTPYMLSVGEKKESPQSRFTMTILEVYRFIPGCAHNLTQQSCERGAPDRQRQRLQFVSIKMSETSKS